MKWFYLLLVAVFITGCTTEVAQHHQTQTPQTSGFTISTASWPRGEMFNKVYNCAENSVKMDLIEDFQSTPHHLDHGQINSWAPFDYSSGLQFGTTVAFSKNESGIMYYYWLPLIETIEPTGEVVYGRKQFKITSKDGSVNVGSFEQNSPTYYYSDPPISIFGQINQDGVLKVAGLKVENLKKLTVDATNSKIMENVAKEFLNSSPATVITQSNQEIKSHDIYIVDYCGHWGGTSWHKRLDSSLQYWADDYTQDYASIHTPTSISVRDISEIEFTGVNGKNIYCPQIIIRKKDGTEITGYMELTSQSFSGTEVRGYPEVGQIMLPQPYGAILISTVKVKKIEFE